MCGIVAMLGPPRVDEGRLTRSLDALDHRGPDGRGVWVSSDRSVALGHRRLAILDLEGGAQPLFNEDRSIVAVVNGELYGFEAQRRDLERRGHRFTTNTDSELIVHLYEEHGASLVDHVRGELAFVLWDSRARVLVAARDRFGIKPLVYARHEGALWVASEAKALFAAGLTPRWDLASIHQCASLQYPLPDRSLFEGVLQLPPGHLLRASEGSVEVSRYWDMDHPVVGDAPDLTEAQTHERVHALRDRLTDAVKVRLRADVPVAFQLSGGIDSSTVLSLASEHLDRPHAFTITFDADSHDELPIARETAEFCGAEIHEIDASTDRLIDVLDDAIAQGEGICINAHVAAKYLLSRAVREAGFRVVLTGEGADEVLAGYPHLRRDIALSTASSSAALLDRLKSTNQASAGVMMPDGETLDLGAMRRSLGFVPSWVEAKGGLGHRVHTMLSDDFLSAFHARDAYQTFLDTVDLRGQIDGRSRVDQSLYLWNKTALAGYILRTLGDGMEMAHGIEGRLAFLDHELFALTRALPLSMKIRDGVEKWVLREAMIGKLPERVRTRQKHPFMAPALSLSPGIEARLRDGSLPSFVDPIKVRDVLDDLRKRTDRERQIWDSALMFIASLGALQRRYRP